ncbi:unnamed protein product [Rotaria sordida]|uniref:Uncharacterized protein n=1 Tax=Rotaria sordida TaxID=392033 RepID=A0A815WZL5_9BILA|nr:unnamed protein product [Rotaria sordida]CAF1286365.1 unnamed protein product [Rotaria sordida]CAF1328045.1 unnamed protein product [Rotaria sordida]CAF1339677.1 unnamed protein product [Rotaria sordida]CAF1552024.1 unnamed protein product [Rotaria sordida]
MTTIECSTINNETLAHLIIINQMTATTGCTYEQAKQLLISTDYRLEAAINLFFDERTMPIPCCKFSELITPANTPATPPNFPETLLSFNKLSTSSGTSSSSSSTSTTTTTTIVSNDNQISSTTTNHSLSSSPMNMTMMMMDGTA